METFSALLSLCTGNSPSPHTGQWRGILIFSLISVWINGWVNNREAVDETYCAHYDIPVNIYNQHIYQSTYKLHRFNRLLVDCIYHGVAYLNMFYPHYITSTIKWIQLVDVHLEASRVLHSYYLCRSLSRFNDDLVFPFHLLIHHWSQTTTEDPVHWFNVDRRAGALWYIGISKNP